MTDLAKCSNNYRMIKISSATAPTAIATLLFGSEKGDIVALFSEDIHFMRHGLPSMLPVRNWVEKYIWKNTG